MRNFFFTPREHPNAPNIPVIEEAPRFKKINLFVLSLGTTGMHRTAPNESHVPRGPHEIFVESFLIIYFLSLGTTRMHRTAPNESHVPRGPYEIFVESFLIIYFLSLGTTRMHRTVPKESH